MKLVATIIASDSDIMWLFKSCKKDTLDIATELGVTEAYVARRLAYLRDLEYSQKPGAAPA